MKKFTILFISTSLFLITTAKADYWTQKANFPVATVFATGFSIGNMGYIGTGTNGSYTNTFYEYNPVTNAWVQKANFGGATRAGAVSFSIGNLGYIGTGTSGSMKYKDFWQYNPLTNAWTQLADFGGTPRYQGAGFSIGSKGYIGAGNDAAGYQNDFWEYDPTGNTWTQEANVGTLGRYRCFGFSAGAKGYIGCGQNTTFNLVNDFWEYDTTSNTWTQKANVGGGPRYDAACFAIGNYGYIGTGWNGPLQDLWQYDPLTNTWLQKSSFGGVARGAATGFSIGNRGYIGTGGTGGPYLQDFWEYTPDSATSISDAHSSTFDFQLVPNPATEFTVCQLPATFKENATLRVFDATGKEIYSIHPERAKCILPVSIWPKGIYTMYITSGNKKAIKKFVKQ